MSAREDDLRFMAAALQEARRDPGAIPIGAVLVIDGEIVAHGHNRRVQDGNPILHGEMHCLQNAGRRKAAEYRRSTLYTTLSPCDMCSGAILLYEIPRVVMAESRTFRGPQELLVRRGVELVDLDLEEAREGMRDFVREHPELWNEDIGV